MSDSESAPLNDTSLEQDAEVVKDEKPGKVTPKKRSRQSEADSDNKDEKKPKLSQRGAKKRKKTRHESYAIYIHRIMKQVHPDMAITAKSMGILTSLVNDLFERIGSEAARLVVHTDHKTLMVNDVQAAIKLTCPGELAKHAVSEGIKAVTKYAEATKK